MKYSKTVIERFLEKQDLGMMMHVKEDQNKEYEGASFLAKGVTYRSRLAKQTPKKKGAFVAFWEKTQAGNNQAFLAEESPEYLLVAVQEQERRGVFCFPQSVLIEKKIYRTTNQKGKMAMRVYPSWATELNSTALKTQQWQTSYFYEC